MVLVKEFNSEEQAVHAANLLFNKGALKEEVYVLAYSVKATSKLADQSNAEKIGLDDIGVTTTLKNLFRGKEDVLQTKLEEIGLPENEAHIYKEKLSKGKILVISKNETASI